MAPADNKKSLLETDNGHSPKLSAKWYFERQRQTANRARNEWTCLTLLQTGDDKKFWNEEDVSLDRSRNRQVVYKLT